MLYCNFILCWSLSCKKNYFLMKFDAFLKKEHERERTGQLYPQPAPPGHHRGRRGPQSLTASPTGQTSRPPRPSPPTAGLHLRRPGPWSWAPPWPVFLPHAHAGASRLNSHSPNSSNFYILKKKEKEKTPQPRRRGPSPPASVSSGGDPAPALARPVDPARLASR